MRVVGTLYVLFCAAPAFCLLMGALILKARGEQYD